MPRLLLAALLAGLTATGYAQSAVPTLISYQGKVTDAAGTPIGNTTPVNRVVTFRVWKSPTSVAAADRLYTEQQTVTIAGGEFSVLLGAGTPLAGETNVGTLDAIFDGSARFLGLTIDDPAVVNDPEITPRQQIATTAFAFRAKVAEGVTSQSVNSTMLANNAVGTAQVADAAVTFSKLATNAVDTVKITDNAVTTAKVADGSITSAKFAAGLGVWQTALPTSPRVYYANPDTTAWPNGLEVGVNTTTPYGPLGVYQGGAVQNPRIHFMNDTSGQNSYVRGLYVGLAGANAYMANFENGVLDFNTTSTAGSSTIRQRIEADGRFGFGVLNGDNNLDFYFKANGTRNNILKVQRSNGAEGLVLNSSGQLGIGTASINSTVALYDAVAANFSNIRFYSQFTGTTASDGGEFSMWAPSTAGYTNFQIFNREFGSIDFHTTATVGAVSTRRMRIEPDGRMGFNMDNGESINGYIFQSPNATASTIVNMRSSTGFSAFSFNADGNAFTAPGGGWRVASDARLKHDISPIYGALEKLSALNPVEFYYTDTERYGKDRRTGFIAQELETIYPEWVTTGPDGFRAVGFPGFEAVATKALQELRAEKDAQIHALQAQVADLAAARDAQEARLAALEKRLEALAAQR